MRNDNENIIVNKSFQFALMLIEYVELLETNKKYVISRQLLKSGTSIGANIREAQNAKSKKDFIHKLKISAKEVDETIYWIEICKQSKNYPNPTIELENLLLDITKILSKIISTSKTMNEIYST